MFLTGRQIGLFIKKKSARVSWDIVVYSSENRGITTYKGILHAELHCCI